MDVRNRRLAWPGRVAQPGAADDPIAHLLACHARIRDHVALANRLAAPEASRAPAAEIAECASSLARYFGIALPLHVADEEESLRPRLRGVPALVPILDQLGDEHALIETALGALVPSFERVAADPARWRDLEAARDDLRRLGELLEGHLVVEETQLFPALEGLLSPSVRAEIRAEQRARR